MEYAFVILLGDGSRCARRQMARRLYHPGQGQRRCQSSSLAYLRRCRRTSRFNVCLKVGRQSLVRYTQEITACPAPRRNWLGCCVQRAESSRSRDQSALENPGAPLASSCSRYVTEQPRRTMDTEKLYPLEYQGKMIACRSADDRK